jgi:hypothetical protein
MLRWSTVPEQVHVPRSCVVRSWVLLHEETRFAGGDESGGSAALRPRATPHTLHFSSTLPYTGRVQISVRRTPRSCRCCNPAAAAAAAIAIFAVVSENYLWCRWLTGLQLATRQRPPTLLCRLVAPTLPTHG